MTSATSPATSPALPACGAARLRPGLGGDRRLRHGAGPAPAALPHRPDRRDRPPLAGVIVFAPKAWDVVLNPVVGRISDRSTAPRRQAPALPHPRRPALAACFALLFLGPTSPQWAGAAWVAVAYLACATAYSFFQVPYVAMPAEITDDYDERTRLMTWRVAILAFAILVSGGALPRHPRRLRARVGLPGRRLLRRGAHRARRVGRVARHEAGAGRRERRRRAPPSATSCGSSAPTGPSGCS